MADEVKDAKAQEMQLALEREMSELSGTQRAAVIMLLLGEHQASDIIRFLTWRCHGVGRRSVTGGGQRGAR
jgi:hypothetical protein